MMLLLIHAVATLLMTGVVLFVAVVHYPMFARVGTAEFPAYSREHASRTTIVVAPLMLIEALTGVLLLVPSWSALPPGATRALWIGAALLIVVWGITFGINVPQHARLANGFDARVHRQLVASHWVRTAAWCARAGVVSVALAIARG
jgi:hypothetical protein